jgi:AbrB family looped-hinge helix DNA binding protein
MKIPARGDVMPSATINSKGQLTLPKAIRDLLRLGADDRVDFVVKDDGTVVLRSAAVDVRELRGMLRRKGLTPLTIEEMNAIVRRRGSGRA